MNGDMCTERGFGVSKLENCFNSKKIRKHYKMRKGCERGCVAEPTARTKQDMFIHTSKPTCVEDKCKWRFTVIVYLESKHLFV
jgi:hypothetical protein